MIYVASVLLSILSVLALGFRGIALVLLTPLAAILVEFLAFIVIKRVLPPRIERYRNLTLDGREKPLL